MTDAAKSSPKNTKATADKGSIQRASIKEAIGKLTGDVTIEAAGRAEKNSSKSDAKSGSARRS